MYIDLIKGTDHEKGYMFRLRLRSAQEKWPQTQNGKQNYRCLDCGRHFVADYAFKTVTEEEIKALIKKVLLERNALRGICRISMSWRGCWRL